MTCGTTDKDRHFHPFGVCLSFNEKEEDFQFLFQALKETAQDLLGFEYQPTSLVANSAPSITNGFVSVFGNGKRGICWAHATRGIDALLKSVKDKSVHRSISEDIDELQVSPTENIFNVSRCLFFKKYESEYPVVCQDLRTFWFAKPADTWYEGYQPGLPSTTNNIESFHLNSLKAPYKKKKPVDGQRMKMICLYSS